jgi:hypothetical protein
MKNETASAPFRRQRLTTLLIRQFIKTHGDRRSIYRELRQMTPGEPMVTLVE